MALGCSIAAILKRSSHVFSDNSVVVKIDWLEQLNRRYIQVQGKEQMSVRFIAEQLGLEGSFIPHTYIEQIQLEKLVNELNVHTFSTRRDKAIAKLTRIAVNNRMFDGREPESSMINQEAGQISEQISTLNERIYEFCSRMEELNSTISSQKACLNQQTPALQIKAYNKFTPSTCNQSNNDSPLTNELMLITQGQHQIMQQLGNLTILVHQHLDISTRQGRSDSISRLLDSKMIMNPVLVLAIGGVGFFFIFKSLNRR